MDNKKITVICMLIKKYFQESKRLLHQRLINCGFKVEKEEIFTSLTAARDLIVKNQYRPFFIVDDRAMEDFEGKYNSFNCCKIDITKFFIFLIHITQ